MDIGIGLPNTVPGISGATLLDWAREGERYGLASLAVTDRLVYDSYDGLTTLAAAAAVTERCRLTTAILISPLRTNTALLAKEVATVDRLSGGRLVLGLAVGMRPDDFAASGAEMSSRGSRFDGQLDELTRIWAGERRGFAGGIGPAPSRPGGPELLIGGHSPAAVRRAATRATGWICGGGGPGMFADGAGRFRATWNGARREGKPRLLALAYFAVGPDATRHTNTFLRRYYGFAPPYAEQVVRHAAVGEEKVRELIGAYALAGCDELIFLPCTAGLDQLETLAAVAATTRPTLGAATGTDRPRIRIGTGTQ